MKKIETNILEKKFLYESDVIDTTYDSSYEWNLIKCYPKEKMQTWYGWSYYRSKCIQLSKTP